MRGLITGTHYCTKAYLNYRRLKREGYYIRPEKFDNTTVYVICKDDKDPRQRTVFAESGEQVAKILAADFDFKIVDPVPYFGKETPVENGQIRYWTKSKPENLLI